MPVAQLIPSNLYRFSLGKQSAWGTAATNPDYQIPVYDADIGPTEERQPLSLIEGQAYLGGEYKTLAGFGGTTTFAAHPDSNARIFAAHFGTSSDTMTGAGDPRTHTFARKDTPLPHTFWVGRPVAGGTFEYDKGVDVICKKLTVKYENGQLLKLETEWVGASSVGVATAPTPGTTIYIPTAGNFGHTWLGAANKMDFNATPATTSHTEFSAWSITSEYAGAKFVQTQNLNGDYYDQGLWALSGEATALFQNWQAYNWTFYGSTSPSANAAQSSTAPSGAIDFTVQQEPVSANRTLQAQVPYCQIKSVRPTPNADGSGISAQIQWVLSQPPSGEPYTVIEKTAVATSYS